MRLQSDERLAELAVDGHEAAFAAIVDRYRTPLLRYCAGIVGASRAEDAAQQTLINAHDALQRTSDVRHLRSWLYRIAHNASLNVLRAVRDEVPLDPAHAAASSDDPAAAFERSERLRATLAAVQGLPERQRAALVLRELEGRSHEEIADALGVTRGSARQHLMRARTAVRGAVTAITPYPLIARLAELVSGPATGSWADAAVGAGAGATIAKLTAGVMATGALVGGAVGTDQVIHRNHRHGAAGATQTTTAAPARAARMAAPPATTENTALALPTGSNVSASNGATGRSGHGKGGGTGSSSANGGHGGGTSGDDHRSSAGSGSGSGSSGHGSSGEADQGTHSGRGSDDSAAATDGHRDTSGSKSSDGSGEDRSATTKSGSGRSGSSDGDTADRQTNSLGSGSDHASGGDVASSEHRTSSGSEPSGSDDASHSGGSTPVVTTPGTTTAGATTPGGDVPPPAGSPSPLPAGD